MAETPLFVKIAVKYGQRFLAGRGVFYGQKNESDKFWKDPQRRIHVAVIDGKQVGIVQDKDGRLRPSGHASPKWQNDPAYAINQWNKWVAERTGIEPLTDSIALGDYASWRPGWG